MKSRKRHFLAGSALTILTASHALAQTPAEPAQPAAQGAGIADIIVTARRTDESIQTTPVAVSALSGEALDKAQLTNVSQLQNSTPSLTISSAVAQPGSATIFIRGQGSSDGLIAIDQAVGTYINGVYSARSSGGAFDMVDMQRVEVLRGPQGTLFGRNTTGGAINLIPNEPTGDFEGSIRADYGNYDTFLTRGVLNVPIQGDEIAVRFAYQHREHSGYGHNVLLDREVAGENGEYIRGSFKIAPSDQPWSVLLQADYTDLRTSGQLVGLKSATATGTNNLLIATCNGSVAFYPPPFNGLAALQPLCPYGAPGDTLQNYVLGQNGNDNPYEVFNNTPAYGNVKAYGTSATLTYELTDAIALKSITAWRGVKTASLSDNDGTPYVLSGGVRPTDGNFIKQDQFSQELQLTGKSFDDRLSWIVGAFYFVENGTDRSFAGSVYPVNLRLGIVDGTIRNRSTAGYGQFTFNLTDTVRLTAGTRYTQDKRSMVIRNRDQNLLTGAVTPSYVPVGGDPTSLAPYSFQRTFDYWSYTLGLDWQATPDAFLYAKTSRAYRSGGFNTRAVTGGVPPVEFDPERVTDYEIGGKFDFLNRHVRLNLAGYYSDFQNVQRNLIGTAGTPPRLVAGIDNAASAHIWGGEAELTVVPVDGLTIGASVGLTYPKYDKFINPLNNLDMSDTPFIYTPKQTYTLNADYEIPFDGLGTLNLHADYSYRTKSYAVPIKLTAAELAGLGATVPVTNESLQNTSKIPGYGLLNGRIAFTLDSPNLELAVYGRNITKKKYFTRLLGLEGTALGVTAYGPGDPRTYGVSATWRF